MIYRPHTVVPNGQALQSLATSGVARGVRRAGSVRRLVPWCWVLGLGMVLASATPGWAQDETLAVRVFGVSACEGDAGTTIFTFRVVSEEPAVGGESFTYHTAGLNDNVADIPGGFPGVPLATGGDDYVPAGPTVVTFDPDETFKTIQIIVNGDTLLEPTEYFFLIFTNLVNVEMEQEYAVGVIVNDETANDVVFTLGEDFVVFRSLVAANPPAKPDPADEYWEFGVEVVWPGQLGFDDEGEPIPADETLVLQCWVNGIPVFRIGGGPACGNIVSENQLERITFENLETIWVFAGPGDDWVNGTFFIGDFTKDLRLFGEDGNDVLLGGGGSDYINGGLGNDYIDAGGGDDRAPEGFDDPFITGGPGDDIVIGGAGADLISGGTGRNLIRGGQGDDEFWSEGEYDILDYSLDPDAVNINLAQGTGTDGFGTTDTIRGGFRVLRGSRHDDTLVAYRNSSMTILGGPGNDTITGSLAGDILYGEGGNDTIYGDPLDLTGDENGGADIIMGGAGNDTIFGGPGADEIYGDGDFVPQNFDEDLTLPGNWPDDQFIQLIEHPLSGQYGNAPRPIIQSFMPPEGEEPLFTDPSGVMIIANCLREYRNPLAQPLPTNSVDMAFSLPASEATFGGPFPTLAYVGVRGGGNDTIHGGGGSDLIAGGAGADTIFGGSDQFHVDIPVGDNDDRHHDFADLIFGDHVVNRPAALQAGGDWGPWLPFYTEDLADPDYPYNDLVYPVPNPFAPDGFDRITRPGWGNDSIRGGFGADVIIGGNGGDFINGNRGNDVIYGDFYFGSEDDEAYALIELYTASGTDVIRGNEGTDYIFGGPGADYIFGGDESDDEGFSERGWESPYIKFLDQGDVIQGNGGADVIVGHDLFGMGTRDIDGDAIDRGLGRRSTILGIDSVSQDTVDYSMVPIVPLGNWPAGVNVDLGYNVPGGYYTAGQAYDGEGSYDLIYGIENVVGSRNSDIIKGTSRSDESWPFQLSGRYRNYFVTDAFGIERFPANPTHSKPGYMRNMLRYIIGYDNILLGEDGDDLLIGRRGADAICGGRGNDKIYGDGHEENTMPPGEVINPDDPATGGNDELWGDEGDDEIYGEWGDDIIHPGPGTDYLSGGNGTDILAFTEEDDVETGGVVVNLREEPVDLMEWSVVAQAYAGYGWPLDPVAEILPPGGWPATTVVVPDDTQPGQSVELVMPGGTVLPGWAYSPANTAAARGLGVARAGGFYNIVVNRHVGPGPFPPGSVLNPDRFEIILGTPYSDVIYGHSTASTIIYGDALEYSGAGSADILIGGEGNDILYGELGSDVLDGRGGDDLLVGGAALVTPPGPQLESETNWVSYKDAPTGVTVNLAETEAQDTVAAGRDKLVEIQNVLGSNFADHLTGNWRVNILLGGPGDDVLIGRADHDIHQNNRTFITSDTLHGGSGNDIADYRLGNPALVQPTAEQYPSTLGPCPPPNEADTCGYITNDGEGGSDILVNIENIRTSDDALLLTPPSKKTMSPGQSVRLDFLVTGGDGRYKVVFDPTTTTKDNLGPDGKVLSTKKVAILAAPLSQVEPASPFEVDQDIPDYQAVRFLEGTPAANGYWRFTVYARPVTTTSFRVTVSDMNDPSQSPDVPARRQVSRLVEVAVTNELKVAIEQPQYTITAGQSVQIRGTASGGVPPYQIFWTADDGSQGTTLSATNILIPVANPMATTQYTLRVVDSTPDSLSQEGTATTRVVVLAPADSGSTAPSGSETPQGGTPTGQQPSGNNNVQPTGTPPTELSNSESVESRPVAPMCGFGVTSWVLLGNLLALAVMKRRRW